MQRLVNYMSTFRCLNCGSYVGDDLIEIDEDGNLDFDEEFDFDNAQMYGPCPTCHDVCPCE